MYICILVFFIDEVSCVCMYISVSLFMVNILCISWFVFNIFQKNNEIEKFKLQGIELEDQRKKILKELEEQQLVCSQEADEYSKKNKEISKILDQLRAGKGKVISLNITLYIL